MYPFRLKVFFVQLILLRTAQSLVDRSVSTNSSVSAIYVFGDSIVDTGNNDYIKTYSKCNFPPYGVDFINNRSTGRFSNGKVITDFFCKC